MTVEELDKKIPHRKFYRPMDNHLECQLRTRVAFTSAPNKVIANLLQTLAEYNVEHGTYENAIMAYTYVLEFASMKAKKREISRAIIELNKNRRASGITELTTNLYVLLRAAKLSQGSCYMELTKQPLQQNIH